jgi:hypothetical protein
LPATLGIVPVCLQELHSAHPAPWGRVVRVRVGVGVRVRVPGLVLLWRMYRHLVGEGAGLGQEEMPAKVGFGFSSCGGWFWHTAILVSLSVSKMVIPQNVRRR